jgi:hypothetical protein
MKEGDEDLIDDQATLLATVQGQIKDMSRMKTTLAKTGTKIDMILQQQRLALSMASVTKALGSVTQTMQPEKASSIRARHQ